MVFPAVGGAWVLPQDLRVEFERAYKGIDLKEELEKARVWLVANPRRLKKDMPRFLNNWLKSAAMQAKQAKFQGAYIAPRKANAEDSPDRVYETEYFRLRQSGEGIEVARKGATEAMERAKKPPAA